MAVFELARYTVDPSDVTEFLRIHPEAVEAVSRAFPGLLAASLGRLDERTWIDIWRWDSLEHAMAAAQGAPSIPAPARLFALIDGAPSIPAPARLFALIEKVVSMDHAAIVFRAPGCLGADAGVPEQNQDP